VKWPLAFERLVEGYRGWRYGTIDASAKLGKRGEQAAAILLRRKGYLVVAESEIDRGGEIDLIAVDRRGKRRVVVFVEVKTLASRRSGHPAERVDENKQARLTRAALRYLKRNRLLEYPCRFDVIAVWWQDRESRVPNRIEHYEAAFEAIGTGQFFA
jgi:putative endonuclease